jgi:creatinine deaminase
MVDANMNEFMDRAIEQAEKSLSENGIPIGSVLVHRGVVIGFGHNCREQLKSPILHAEMAALENAGRLTADKYAECALYTTLSPCAMCSGAILLYGIPHVIIGENKTFKGEERLLRRRGVKLTILNDARCIQLMQEFIEARPDLWFEDIGVVTSASNHRGASHKQ